MDAKNMNHMFIQDHYKLQKAEQKEAAKLQKDEQKEAAKYQKAQEKLVAKVQKALDKSNEKAKERADKARAKQYAKSVNAAIAAAAQMWVREMTLQEKEQLRQAKKAEKTVKKDTTNKQKEQHRIAEQIRKSRKNKSEKLEKGTEKGITCIHLLFKNNRTIKKKAVVRHRPLPNMEGIADFMRK